MPTVRAAQAPSKLGLITGERIAYRDLPERWEAARILQAAQPALPMFCSIWQMRSTVSWAAAGS